MKAVFKGWYPQVGLVEEILLCWNWLITHILIRWVAFQTPQPFHPTRSALPKRVKNLSMLCYLQVTSYSAPCWLWTWLPLLPAAVSESFSGVVHLVGLISNKCKKKTLQHHTCRLSIFLINSQPPPHSKKCQPQPQSPHFGSVAILWSCTGAWTRNQNFHQRKPHPHLTTSISWRDRHPQIWHLPEGMGGARSQGEKNVACGFFVRSISCLAIKCGGISFLSNDNFAYLPL